MILSALLLLTSPVEGKLETGEQLVLVGMDGPRYDACAALGRVKGLKADGDNFLSVRIAPTTKARAKDKVRNGQFLTLCDQEGDWWGVVYKDENVDVDVDCGTGTPAAFLGAYRGPCRYGWVHKNYVEFLAG